MQTVPVRIHSGRIPTSRQPSTKDGRLSHPPHHTAFWRRADSNAAHTADTRTDSSHIEKWPVLSYNKWAAENDAAEGGNLFAERSGYRYLKITLP